MAPSARPDSDTRLMYDDLLLFPDDRKRRELIDGELFVTPSPSARHQVLLGRLFLAMGNYLAAHPGVGRAFLSPLDVVFALREINLSKLESRPLRGRPWEYLFYIEVDARADEPACAEAIAQLGDFAQMLRVLGTYKGAERRWAK